MVTGLALLFLTVVLRAATTNRHIRGRLNVTAVVFGAYTVVAGAIAYGTLSGGMRQTLAPVLPLLFAFGVVNGLVAVVVNPWREERLPDRFPNIVQDTIVIVLFAIAATVILQERIFATTAVGAVVVGFALQDTLGNLFAGLAIQIEKPFRVGHWVRIAETDGQVAEITWRATKVRTKAGNFIIVPNSTLSKDTITNYSEPTVESRVEVEVGASYDVAPNLVKATILEALRDESSMLSTPSPEVLLSDFAASAITYRVRVWTTDFSAHERLRDRMRSAIYYAFRRAGISIPYPIQVEFPGESAPAQLDASRIESAIRRVQIFATLDDSAVGALAHAARPSTYATGEALVREGDAGSSMFVIVHGEAVVSLGSSNQEIARLGAGAFFGEMSLLTGAPRSATVRATTDINLLEIASEPFRTFVLANPSAVELIAAATAQRTAELEQARAGGLVQTSAEAPASLVNRIRRFLKL